MRGLVFGLLFFVLVVAGPACAHEPIFGLGPHTIFKGGVGVEAELEAERTSGAGEVETEYVLHNELIYGVTADLSMTLAVPYIIEKKTETGGVSRTSSGMGDISLRGKYRFWRRDAPGVQDAAAFIVGVKFPTGDDDKSPRLGSGSTDYLFALTAARESLKWYYFADVRYRLNTKGGGGLEKGDRIFADLAVGIRPTRIEYLKPDLVLIAELNWETLMEDELNGVDIGNSGGDRLFFSPSFFFTYRNLAVKGGVQIPIYQNLNGQQPEVDYRFKLAAELHL